MPVDVLVWDVSRQYEPEYLRKYVKQNSEFPALNLPIICTTQGKAWGSFDVHLEDFRYITSVELCFSKQYDPAKYWLVVTEAGRVIFYLKEDYYRKTSDSFFVPEWTPELTQPDHYNEFAHYIQWTITQGDYYTQGLCEASGNSWKNVKVINWLGQKIADVPICFGFQYDSSKAYIKVANNGYLQIMELRELSTEEILRNLLFSALKSASVIATIGVGLGIDAITSDITRITTSLNAVTNDIYNKVKPLIDKVQQATAWIEKTFHVELLRNLNNVGQAISPEYRSVVRSYENYLSEISDKVFKNTAVVPMYMKFYETMLYEQMRKSGVDKDTARYETLKASYNRSKGFNDKISVYSSNPMQLWDDVYTYTFDDMNPYIDKEKALRDAEIIKTAGAISAVAEKTNGALLNIGRFSKMLEIDLAKFNDADIQTLTDKLNDYYDRNISPAVLAVNKANRELKADIDAINKRRDEEKQARERAALMATPPSELSQAERLQQGTQFVDMFNNALQPETKELEPLKVDIEKVVGAIYEQ